MMKDFFSLSFSIFCVIVIFVCPCSAIESPGPQLSKRERENKIIDYRVSQDYRNYIEEGYRGGNMIHKWWHAVTKGKYTLNVEEYSNLIYELDPDDGEPSLSNILSVFKEMDFDNSGYLDLYEVLNPSPFPESTPDSLFSNKDTIESSQKASKRIETYLFNKIGRIQQDIPIEISLSYPDNTGTSMRIKWVTMYSLGDGQLPLVQYRRKESVTPSFDLSPSEWENTVSGISTTYNVGDGGWHGFIHEVNIYDLLLPATDYEYRVGDSRNETSSVFSDVRAFTTAPKVGDVKKQTIAVYGDMGTVVPLGFKVTEQLLHDEAKSGIDYDYIVHVGDISYAGLGGGDELAVVWDVYQSQMEPLASYKPYMVTVGNHESFYNFTAFTHRYNMNNKANELADNKGNGNFWYSFERSNAHWLQISTEHDCSPGSPQYNFVKKDLSQVDRSKTPWLFVTAHRPFLGSSTRQEDDHVPHGKYLTCWEDLLLQYKVDIVFSGHMHCYERSYPFAVNKTCTPSSATDEYKDLQCPIYITQGTSGAMLAEKLEKEKPNYLIKRAERYGYGLLTIEEKKLNYKFRHLKSYRFGIHSETEDEFTIVKN